MKLYVSRGPSPRMVTMFAAEKGLPLETILLDVAGGENRRQPHLMRNPLGTTPVLELSSGQCFSEAIAICEYLEEVRPGPRLIAPRPRSASRPGCGPVASISGSPSRW